MMYTNNLAAICDHSDPSWRSSALGSYRFWRDMGYAIGALITGVTADSIGTPWSVGVAIILTTLAGILVALFYQEMDTDPTNSDGSKSSGEDLKESAKIEAHLGGPVLMPVMPPPPTIPAGYAGHPGFYQPGAPQGMPAASMPGMQSGMQYMVAQPHMGQA
mmetsp:Transcript_45980/g.72034  ORF Transcript_45980/g.72034 Transcript_45980/m.72034 type:complete len:161 (-) Transcript_45980:507-989(-)